MRYSYQLKEVVLALVVFGPVALGLLYWGHDSTTKAVLLIGGALTFLMASLFLLATHKGPKTRSWLAPLMHPRKFRSGSRER
jgi:hypothetical protein